MIEHLEGLEISSIYDFDNAFSINELLCKFWEKIEETINITNECIDILTTSSIFSQNLHNNSFIENALSKSYIELISNPFKCLINV